MRSVMNAVYALRFGLGQSMMTLSGFNALTITAAFSASSQFRFLLLPLPVMLSISIGEMMTRWNVYFFSSTAAMRSRAEGESSLLSLTPSSSSSFSCPSSMATPHMTMGPMMGPRPASSMPTIFIQMCFLRWVLILLQIRVLRTETLAHEVADILQLLRSLENYIYPSCRVKHYGENRTQIRNPRAHPVHRRP